MHHDKETATATAGMNDRQAAAWLGLSVSTLRKYRLEGLGPVYYKLSSRCVYYPEDLQAYRDKGRVEPRR